MVSIQTIVFKFLYSKGFSWHNLCFFNENTDGFRVWVRFSIYNPDAVWCASRMHPNSSVCGCGRKERTASLPASEQLAVFLFHAAYIYSISCHSGSLSSAAFPDSFPSTSKLLLALASDLPILPSATNSVRMSRARVEPLTQAFGILAGVCFPGSGNPQAWLSL